MTSEFLFKRTEKEEEKEHDEIYQMILQIYLGQKKGKTSILKILSEGSKIETLNILRLTKVKFRFSDKTRNI